jgi:hypothetical protein
MNISPFATKSRVHRLEGRLAALEAELELARSLARDAGLAAMRAHGRLSAEQSLEFPTVLSLEVARSLSAVEARLRAHERGVAEGLGQLGRPGPVVLH